MMITSSIHIAELSDDTAVTARLLERAIRAKLPRMKTERSRFLDLPIEILEMIIEMVDDFASDETERRSNCAPCDACLVVRLASGLKEDRAHQPRTNPCSHSDLPILSINSVALMNRKLHELSVPQQWKSKMFPSSIASIEVWEDHIIPKYGSLIQHLRVHLSHLSVQFPVEPLKLDKSGDDARGDFNLNVMTDSLETLPSSYPKILSLQAVLMVLEGCPNLQSLFISTSLFHAIKKGNVGPFNDTSFGEHIGQLQRLQSLALLGNPFVHAGNLWSLPGLYLSSLRHLTVLLLHNVDSVDASWCEYNWTQPLLVLQLVDCKNVTPSVIHWLCNAFASTLDTLSYHENQDRFLYQEEEEEKEDTHTKLCSLTPLVLSRLRCLSLTDVKQVSLLHAFQDCKNLKNITYDIMNSNEGSSIQKLICESTWPHLEELNLSIGNQNALSQAHITELSHFCRMTGVKFKCDGLNGNVYQNKLFGSYSC